jgi:hypothetical protein
MDGGEGPSNRRLHLHYGTLALPTSGAGLDAASTIEEVGETGDVLIMVDVVLVMYQSPTLPVWEHDPIQRAFPDGVVPGASGADARHDLIATPVARIAVTDEIVPSEEASAGAQPTRSSTDGNCRRAGAQGEKSDQETGGPVALGAEDGLVFLEQHVSSQATGNTHDALLRRAAKRRGPLQKKTFKEGRNLLHRGGEGVCQAYGQTPRGRSTSDKGVS